MRLKKQQKEFTVRHGEATPVQIISDAMIATADVGDGRSVPLVIVDTDTRPDIAEMIRVHEHLPVGDHTVQWGQIDGHDGTIVLFFQFIRPAEVNVVLEFDIEKQGGVVDSIISSRALYIQGGRDGDRLSTTWDHPRILVEVGDLGIDEYWDRTLRKHLTKRFRRQGQSRAEAKRAVEQCLRDWRRMTAFRVHH